MEIINLLVLLNSVKSIHTLSYAESTFGTIDYLNIISKDEMFIKKIDLGVMFIKQQNLEQFKVIDGFGRLLSLSLLLHAVCECYKKTSQKNDKAIENIRTKYLLNGNTTKLKFSPENQKIYDKIIFGERLSGREKETPMFQILHNFWLKIKEEKLQAAKIFESLSKIYVSLVDVENFNERDLYYSLNKNNRLLNQKLLIENFITEVGVTNSWSTFKKVLKNNKISSGDFFKDFFITKLNSREYNPDNLYEIFINYYNTMIQYIPKDEFIDKIKHIAELYSDIININFDNENIKRLMIKIKMHNGDDTYAYLLNIYEDYSANLISETTFLEILSTIDEYLVNRLKTPNNVDFNELITYLNTFIVCK